MNSRQQARCALVAFFGTMLASFGSASLAAERYGGVEIGAKGIKAAAVEVGGTDAAPALKELKIDKKTTEVTISRLKGKKFDAVRIDDAAAVVKDYVDVLVSKLGVPQANIQVVASSGVPFAKNFGDLTSAIQAQTGKVVVKIDALEEAALSALAIVPTELRSQVLLVDIGSGNTKGGAFLDDSGKPDRFAVLEVPFGTITLGKAIKEKEGMTPAAVAHELVGSRLQKVLADNPVLAQRDKIIMAGGAVWAFMTIMKPETAADPFPKMTADDIRQYVELLNRTPGEYPKVDFDRIADAKARQIALADYDRIRGARGDVAIFKPEDLQSGAALLSELSASMDFANRSVHFDRNAVTAWITARITPERYRHLLPAALRRKFRFSAVTQSKPPQPPQAQRFGGIEIGSKGIKAAAIEIGGTANLPVVKELKIDKKTNEVTLSRLKGQKFENVRIDDAAAVVKDFFGVLQTKLGVPEANIQVVASSGVPFAKNFPDLVNAVREQTGKPIIKIDAREEGCLDAIAMLPADLRMQVLVVDIGSGNTKGGTFSDDSGRPDRFAVLNVPFGTVTLAEAIKNQSASEGQTPDAIAHKLIGLRLQQELAEKPILGQRDKIALAGGAVWAFITITRPETALDPFPKVTAEDIIRYVDLVNGTAGAYPGVDFNRISNLEARRRAVADYNSICGIGSGPAKFRPEDLRSGAAILSELSTALDFANRSVHFNRNAVTAWITARITPAQYRTMLPAALGYRPVFSAVRPPKPPGDGRRNPADDQVPKKPTINPFVPPVGLSQSAEELLGGLGYVSSSRVYDPSGCVDYAKACLRHDLDSDALILLNHALLQDNSKAHIWYLKGLAEIHLKRNAAAAKTAIAFQQASTVSDPALAITEETFNEHATSVFFDLVRIFGPNP